MDKSHFYFNIKKYLCLFLPVWMPLSLEPSGRFRQKMSKMSHFCHEWLFRRNLGQKKEQQRTGKVWRVCKGVWTTFISCQNLLFPLFNICICWVWTCTRSWLEKGWQDWHQTECQNKVLSFVHFWSLTWFLVHVIIYTVIVQNKTVVFWKCKPSQIEPQTYFHLYHKFNTLHD